MKSCVIFCHEDFGGQLIWALPRYVTVDIQGPEEAFFEEEPQQPTTRAVGNAESAVDPSGTAQDNTNQQNDATTTATTTTPEDLPMEIQDLSERGIGAMDIEEIEVNCYLAESYFTSRKSDNMLDIRKSLSHQLIENDYFDQEAESQCSRSIRIQEGIGHKLMSLPPFKFFRQSNGAF